MIYASAASTGLRATDLEAIARRSRINNDAEGLTGFLLYQRPRFYAVLEGESEVLFARMERIATDVRHSRLRVLREEPVRRRRFSNWSFGMLPGSAHDIGNSETTVEFLQTLSRRLRG